MALMGSLTHTTHFKGRVKEKERFTNTKERGREESERK